jgi:hypothetical protein
MGLVASKDAGGGRSVATRVAGRAWREVIVLLQRRFLRTVKESRDSAAGHIDTRQARNPRAHYALPPLSSPACAAVAATAAAQQSFQGLRPLQ